MIDPDTNENSPSMRFAKRLFNIMDENKDGQLSIEEFVKGFHKLKVDGNCYGDVIVTAYVSERKLTKEDLLPKPAIQLKRKSLRDGSNVKLFNNEAKCGDDPEAKLANGKGNDQAVVINAASIASAAKAATIISAKAKMHKEVNSTDSVGVKDVQGTVINAASIALAAKSATIMSAKVRLHKEDKCTNSVAAASKLCAKAKAKMHKKEAVRKIRKVWKINLFNCKYW